MRCSSWKVISAANTICNVIRKQMKTIRKEMEKSGRLDHMVESPVPGKDPALSWNSMRRVTIDGQPLEQSAKR